MNEILQQLLDIQFILMTKYPQKREMINKMSEIIKLFED